MMPNGPGACRGQLRTVAGDSANPRVPGAVTRPSSTRARPRLAREALSASGTRPQTHGRPEPEPRTRRVLICRPDTPTAHLLAEPRLVGARPAD